jgi:C-terminal processing protease CtpA/Prc
LSLTQSHLSPSSTGFPSLASHAASVSSQTRRVRPSLASASSQIGIMLLGTMVDNLVVGGPAFNSRQLQHGDIIVKVDGTPVTQANIHEMMVGNDIPGTPVLVSVTRGGPKVTAAAPPRPAKNRMTDDRK